MQTDFFETNEHVYLKTLRAKKKQIQEDLAKVNRDITKLVGECQGYHLGGKLYLGRAHNGDAVIYTSPEATGSISRLEVEFFSPVSLDLLDKALQQLKQENHYAPKAIPGDHGSQTSHSPW